MAAIAGELQTLQRAPRIPATDLLSSIVRSAMGWLFGCFGASKSRRERLPRLCSRTNGTSAHHRNKSGRHSKGATYAANATTPGSVRIYDAPSSDGLKRLHASTLVGSDGLRRLSVETSPAKRLVDDQAPKAEARSENHRYSTNSSPVEVRSEISHKRSPSISPIPDWKTSSVRFVEENPSLGAEFSTLTKLGCTSRLNPVTTQLNPVSTQLSPVTTLLNPVTTPSDINVVTRRVSSVNPTYEAHIDDEREESEPNSRAPEGLSLTPVHLLTPANQPISEAENLAEVTKPRATMDLPKLLPNSGGFFMFPRKRSLGYRSLMWQEPLSPVAESESSLSSSDEERQPRKCPALEPVPSTEEETSSDTGYASPRHQTPSSDQSPGAKSDTSGGDLTPVQCVSPTLSQKSGRMQSDAEKENGLGTSAKREERPEDSQSVLTPVGNLMQWKQIKQKAFEVQLKNSTKAASRMDHVVEESLGTDDTEAELEFEASSDAESCDFFREVLQGSTVVATPQTAGSRWGFWEGSGIPNTTSKYKEDQQVLWHSTPFEVRLDKALAKQASDVQQR